MPDEIEALIALGRREEAQALLDWFQELARRLDRRRRSPRATAAAAY